MNKIEVSIIDLSGEKISVLRDIGKLNWYLQDAIRREIEFKLFFPKTIF
ncbi:hypothetical protein AALB47_12335 [Lachnospiraceae bacterium 54-11]|jgi:hypothetical protein|nr:hypothetical protein [Lachnospiraceae bacterium]